MEFIFWPAGLVVDALAGVFGKVLPGGWWLPAIYATWAVIAIGMLWLVIRLARQKRFGLLIPVCMILLYEVIVPLIMLRNTVVYKGR